MEGPIAEHLRHSYMFLVRFDAQNQGRQNIDLNNQSKYSTATNMPDNIFS